MVLLAFCSLFLFNLKILFQEICKQKLNWDEIKPGDFRDELEQTMLSLQDMEKISLFQNVLPQTDCQQKIELYGFNDNSLQGYSACVYLIAVSKFSMADSMVILSWINS